MTELSSWPTMITVFRFSFFFMLESMNGVGLAPLSEEGGRLRPKPGPEMKVSLCLLFSRLALRPFPGLISASDWSRPDVEAPEGL